MNTITCPDCSESFRDKRGRGCETCGDTGLLVIEATEIIIQPVTPAISRRRYRYIQMPAPAAPGKDPS